MTAKMLDNFIRVKYVPLTPIKCNPYNKTQYVKENASHRHYFNFDVFC